MKVENVFGQNIIRIQCNDASIYHDEELTKTLNQIFNSEMVQKRARGYVPTGL